MIVESGGSFPLAPFLFLIAVAVVGLTGWLVWAFMNRSRGNQTVPPPEKASAVDSSRDYLLTLRRLATGEWEIRVYGQRYRRLEAVPEEQVRQEVVAGMREAANFARSYVKQRTAQTSEPTPQPSREASPEQPSAAQAFAPAPSPTAPERKPASPPAQREPATRPLSEASPLLARIAQEPRLVRSDAPPTLLPAIDLAKDIGEIVDEILPGHPELRGRSIRLQNAPSGGILFVIDGIPYESVEEIPEAEIRDLIRAATKEWERR